MSYLLPPPGNAPVVVVKDVGGFVDQYDRQTALYLQTNREVRLHECRSACTLALALPNVCVYPGSLLKFHKAYNPDTKQANEEISNAMMAAYPPAVRQRLGELTRNYKVLTGSELIRLGIRDCNAPAQPRIMVARATPKQNPPENPVSNAFGGLVAALTPQSALATVSQVRVASVRAEPPKTEQPKTEPAKAEPPRIDAAKPESPKPESPKPDSGAAPMAEAAPLPQSAPLPPQAQRPQPGVEVAAPPTPPVRPAAIAAKSTLAAKPALAAATSSWGRPIKGSTPILIAYRFTPFPYRLASRD